MVSVRKSCLPGRRVVRAFLLAREERRRGRLGLGSRCAVLLAREEVGGWACLPGWLWLLRLPWCRHTLVRVVLKALRGVPNSFLFDLILFCFGFNMLIVCVLSSLLCTWLLGGMYALNGLF